jgi:MFS family permease
MPLLAFATLLASLGLGMLVPALPMLTAGEGPAAQSFLVSLFGVARLVCSLPAGWLADRLGLRRVAVAGLLLLVAGSALGALDGDFRILSLALALQGAGSAVFATVAMTGLVLLAGPAGRARAMTLFQAALLLAFSIGPMIGGVLIGAFGVRAPFLSQALCAALALTLVPQLPAHAGAPIRRGGQGGRVLTPGLVGGMAMAFAAFSVRITVPWVVAPAFAIGVLHLSAERLGLIVGVGTLVNLAILPINTRLIGAYGATAALGVSVVTTAAGIVLGLVPSEPALWGSIALIMAGTGALLPSAGVLVLEGSAPEQTGRTMGLFRTCGDIGMAAGPVLVAAIASRLGTEPANAYLVSLGLLGVCAAVLLASRLGPFRPAAVGG